MKKCPYCKKVLPDEDISACPHCGRMIAYCSQCNSPMREDQKQCTVCGYVRDDSELITHCKVCGSIIPVGGEPLCEKCRHTYMKCKACGKIQPIHPSGLCKECRLTPATVKSEEQKHKKASPTPLSGGESATTTSPARPITVTVAVAVVVGILAFLLGMNMYSSVNHWVKGGLGGSQSIQVDTSSDEEEKSGDSPSGNDADDTMVTEDDWTTEKTRESRYQVIQRPCSWTEANKLCQDLNKGGKSNAHLAIINDLDEFYRVCDEINAFNKEKSEEDSLYYVWVGAQLSSNEDWTRDSRWLDGTSMELLWDQKLWWPDQPSDTDQMNGDILDENCLQLWAAKFPDGSDHGWTFNDSCDELNKMERYVNPKRIGLVIEFE